MIETAEAYEAVKRRYAEEPEWTEAAEREVARLREALAKYGQHYDGIRFGVFPCKSLRYARGACTCGLEAALDAAGVKP